MKKINRLIEFCQSHSVKTIKFIGQNKECSFSLEEPSDAIGFARINSQTLEVFPGFCNRGDIKANASSAPKKGDTIKSDDFLVTNLSASGEALVRMTLACSPETQLISRPNCLYQLCYPRNTDSDVVHTLKINDLEALYRLGLAKIPLYKQRALEALLHSYSDGNEFKKADLDIIDHKRHKVGNILLATLLFSNPISWVIAGSVALLKKEKWLDQLPTRKPTRSRRLLEFWRQAKGHRASFSGVAPIKK